MEDASHPQVPPSLVHSFVTELLRTGLMLTDTLATLLEDMPEDSFPGEDSGEVVLEMLCGTLQPVADMAGAETLEDFSDLLVEVRDQFLTHLRMAAELSRRDAPPV
ncbi:MAG: hypothetical protein M3383_10175 [Actinomycetota bacterium]|nr:hypothetical protein [Actinomycetota bacterium]